MEFLKDKYPIIFSLIICGLMLLYAYGCEPKTTSLIEPSRKVTRPELVTELDILIAKSDIAFSDLERQEKLRSLILQQTLTFHQTGIVDPVGLITSLMAVLGIGAVADDVRLRKKIKNNS